MKEKKLINAAMIFARADFGSHVRVASRLVQGFAGDCLPFVLFVPGLLGFCIWQATSIPISLTPLNFRVCSTCSHGWIDPMPPQGLLNYLYARGSRSVISEWGPSQLTIPEQVCVHGAK
jgi:hypothetical protein